MRNGPPSLRWLRVLLLLLTVDAGGKGLLLIFGGRWVILRLSPNLPPSEITSFLLLSRLECGALDLGLCLMLWLAFLNPGQNRAVIIGTAVALAGGAIAEVVGTYLLHGAEFFSPPILWLHSAARITVAGLLLHLRPR